MSKKKLLINEVFEQAKRESDKTSKNGLAMYLKVHLETFKLFLDEKTFSRYYDSFVTGIKNETNPDPDTLDKLSQYIGYKNFADFSRTFVKREEEANKTTVKISVDHDEESLTEKLSKIIINITNEQHFKIPEFIKKNGLGIMEMALLLVFVTSGVVFPNTKSNSQSTESSFTLPFIGKSHQDKKYMYWNGERYIATDSSSLGPQLEVIPMNEQPFKYLKLISRPDTLTVENALHKVWYSKSNNEVEFFTSFGKHPENGKALKDATEYIIETYGGQ
ncbi:hypothetical protein [Chryseobacterium shandongense]|uniref:Helix-turn-helix domain-containing protein n=1 Tax=Chryseobacterium shandongense TaxID=1493872 RepID=A0ABM7BBU2_9FLAO|nr:hypothetical protein [Chryseobacterium shandongense]AZA96233.1 hypothetical protein EG353_11945 [Chryseobacterium shandongense]